MTKKRRTKLKTIKRDSDGFNLCRWCKNPVSPPRRTFCSNKCVHEHKIRSNPSYARDLIYKRDLGKCSKCGIDTRYTKIELEDLRQKMSRDFKKNEEYIDRCKKLKITVGESLKSLWHMDHIIPVFKGGGECGLDNYQTHCVSCHKEKTNSDRKSKIK